MYTQCTNCQAIFRASMREVTVSKGLLRCSECLEIFDSSENLSTTMQAPFTDTELHNKAKQEKITVENLQTISSLDDWQSSSTEDKVNLDNNKTKETILKKRPSYKANEFTTRGAEITDSIQKNKKVTVLKWPVISAVLLASLLIFQVAFNYRHLFVDTLKYDPKKVQMLNHNVFAHPIDKDVLLISASIQNTADYDQPFPILEVRLTNSKAKLVALRRFSPDEYLDNYSTDKLLIKNREISIKLKIQDPGDQAKRFQFDFL